MKVLKVVTVAGPKAAGAVAAALNLTVDAAPAEASEKSTAAAAEVAAAAAAARAQKKSAKIKQEILDPPKIQQEFVNPPKIQAAPPEIQIIFADPPKLQWTHQKYNNKKYPPKVQWPLYISTLNLLLAPGMKMKIVVIPKRYYRSGIPAVLVYSLGRGQKWITCTLEPKRKAAAASRVRGTSAPCQFARRAWFGLA
jgi:hypothetical protein